MLNLRRREGEKTQLKWKTINRHLFFITFFLLLFDFEEQRFSNGRVTFYALSAALGSSYVLEPKVAYKCISVTLRDVRVQLGAIARNLLSKWKEIKKRRNTLWDRLYTSIIFTVFVYDVRLLIENIYVGKSHFWFIAFQSGQSRK